MRQATKGEVGALPYAEPFADGTLELFFAPEGDLFMQAAKEALSLSTDKRHSTAAVIVKDGRILAAAANQSGYKHAFLIRWHQTWFCIRRWVKAKSGTKYWLCPGCAKAKDHAESRASKQAALKYPDKVKGADLYLYGHYWCCKPCCDAMIKAGVRKVILLEGAKETFK